MSARTLKDADGRIVGAFDSVPFGRDGRRPWQPRPRAAADRAPRDLDIDTTPSMADVLGPSYYRLP